MSSLSNNFKAFLYKYSHIVDFLSASLIISLCLILLLPKVHESFQAENSNLPRKVDMLPNLIEDFLFTPTTATTQTTIPEQHHHHHHKHTLPVGEIIICLGFFVFYCIGLCSTQSRAQANEPERQPLLLAKRKVTPYYVEEIRITRRPIEANESGMGGDAEAFFEPTNIKYPLSARIGLFALLLACALIVFDININGLMETIKVFRAAATGALLYVAFILVLPRGPSCKVCVRYENTQSDSLTSGRHFIH